ncbi:MAG TPA: aldehyde dehydrogenase family protein [Polyangiaceae bacterium]|nr:aldehyde dehydrogenase family protein [Polyangiaceae bacterium]
MLEPTTSSAPKSDPDRATDRDASPRTVVCHDPATLEPLGEIVAMSEPEVRAVVARGRAVQAAWAKTSFAERRAVLRDLLTAIVEQQDEICRLASKDSGKTMVDALLGEVFPVCEKIRYVLSHGEKDLAPERRPSGFLMHKKAWVEWSPLGVVGVICPWNFPFHNIYCPMVPALFAGNAVVCKVSEHTSWSAEPLVRIVRDVLTKRGHDPDLVQYVTGFGETGAALVRSGVDKIFFTGSPENGMKVMKTASENLTPVVLELGGKDPMIVCDDADLDHAVRQAMLGVYTACGQMCVGAERIYVFESVYDAFVEKVEAKVRALRQGPPQDGDVGEVDVGAMTMPGQLDILDRLVGDAVQKGARALVGGKRNASLRGQFFEPTILVDVDHTMQITQKEQFGPIMVIVKVHGEEDAIRLANDCPYALGSSVFTKDVARGERIARRIRAGMSVVNDYGLAYMIQSLPFGGVGLSGLGRINGREGLRACCNEKAMVSDRVSLAAGVSVYPIQRATFDVTKSVIGLIYGDGVVAKGRAAARALASVAGAVLGPKRG